MYLASTENWYLERLIWLIAGSLVLLATALGYFVSARRFILDLLVGINLIFFALTGFCLMANLLIKLGIQPQKK